MAEETKDKRYSLKKQLFSMLPTSGEWWGKKIDLVWSLILIAGVIWVGVQVKNTFFKPDPSLSQKSDTRIAGNVEALNTIDDHSVTNETHYHLPLSDLFNWIFGANKVKHGE